MPTDAQTHISLAFLSTLSLRRATAALLLNLIFSDISIHALLAESDCWRSKRDLNFIISIHALLAESDLLRRLRPTLPSNFYPRSPCGERQVPIDEYQAAISISIHALLAESDPGDWLLTAVIDISIHALLAESDFVCVSSSRLLQDFYPRSPCGERQEPTGA